MNSETVGNPSPPGRLPSQLSLQPEPLIWILANTYTIMAYLLFYMYCVPLSSLLESEAQHIFEIPHNPGMRARHLGWTELGQRLAGKICRHY